MRELPIDKLDSLLTLAAARCVQDEAESFLSADISGIEDNPALEKKILNGRLLKNIRGGDRITRRGIKWTIKISALVALLCLSIAFTACMFVPVIREAIWNTIVEWYEDHMEVSFTDSEIETEAPTEPLQDEIPTSIERKARLTYLPEGIEVREESFSKLRYHVTAYMPNGEWKFAFSQSIIDGSDSFVNNESGDIVYLRVNDHTAIFTEYKGEEVVYSLVWQDGAYRYTLYGYFDSVTELIKIAEGVGLP